MARKLIGSGAPWEASVGYSRAVVAGPWVFVAGTTSTRPDGQVLHEGDVYLQAREALCKIEKALEQAGAGLEDVVATRMYVTDIRRWEEVGRAHGEFFREVRPAATLVEVKGLVDPRMLVEIEAVAYRGEGSEPG